MGPDEVSYHEFLVGQKKDGQGFAKILGACKFEFSRIDGSFYGDSWINTASAGTAPSF
jgi:hypothetical protein